MTYKMSWMYLAGFFDGEGCISHSISNTGYKYYHIQITQKPIKILKIIRIFLLRYDIESAIYLNDENQCHILKITSKINQALFLNRILPYLIVKRDKAEECIEWIKQRKDVGQKGRLHLTEKRKIKELRSLGLNYSQIGKEIRRTPNCILVYCKKESIN